MREFTVPPLAAAPHVGGLADAVFEHARKDPHRVALGRKDTQGRWRDVTCGTFRDEVLALAKGLLAHGVRFGDRVAIMSGTRYEWTLFDFALWTVGAQPVPMYPTASAEQVFWMLQDASVSACVVEHEDHAMTVGSVIDRLPHLKRLWQLDAGAVGQLVEAGSGIDDEVVHRHRQAVTPDSVATVVYTSGTTGRPKGCVLSHAHFMYEADVVISRWEPAFRSESGEDASLLLFLPLAHVFGRMAEVVAIRGRVKLGHHPNLDHASLLTELAAFRPSSLVAVPYVFEMLYGSVRRAAEREDRTGAFRKAEEVAVRYAEALERRAFGLGPGPSTTLRMRHRLYEKSVYGGIRDVLGGLVRHVFCAGSTLDRRLGLFFEGVGISLYEGYGLTESCAAATISPPGRARHGTVGVPLPGTTVHIAEDGEVWLRGGHLFSGYLDDQEATDTVLKHGWLATGDLGTLDQDGYLTLTGRKKEILVTSSGASVSPWALEERVRSHPLVAQCLVIGNGRPHVAALVTMDQDAVEHWLLMRGEPPLKAAEMVRDPELEKEIRQAVVTANAGAAQAEPIRTFRILAHPFSEKSGLLTPSLALRRQAIEDAYSVEVEALYR